MPKRKRSKAYWGKNRCKWGDFYKALPGRYGQFTGHGDRRYDGTKDPRNGQAPVRT